MYTLSYGVGSGSISPAISSRGDRDQNEDEFSSDNTLYASEEDLSMMMPEYTQKRVNNMAPYNDSSKLLLEYPDFSDEGRMVVEDMPEYLESGVILDYSTLGKVSDVPTNNITPMKAWLASEAVNFGSGGTASVNHRQTNNLNRGLHVDSPKPANHSSTRKAVGQPHRQESVQGSNPHDYLLQPQTQHQYSPPAQKFLPGNHVIGSRARFEIQSLDPTFIGIPGTLKNREDSQKKKFSKMFRWDRRPSDKHREFVDLLQFPKGNK
jgi:hypothetical protein